MTLADIARRNIDNAQHTMRNIGRCDCRKRWWQSRLTHTDACRARAALDADARTLVDACYAVLDDPCEATREAMSMAVRLYRESLTEWASHHPGRVTVTAP